MRLNSERYSYRNDPAIADFSDDHLITVMDAHCSLCARGARWISRNDRGDKFRIISLQSPLGHALMLHYGMNPDDPLSWLYLEQGRAYSSLDAMIRVGTQLGGIWRGLSVMRILPRPLQDFLYGVVARNRYRLGQSLTLCEMPDPDVQRRLLK